MQILIQEGQGEAGDSAFPAGSQVPVLLVGGTP